jgi:DNA-binding response OmpR family regulator
MANERSATHVLLAISDPQAAAHVARALRKYGMTVDVAMNARIASEMGADGSYDVVVSEHMLGPELGLPLRRPEARHPAVLEITASTALDSDQLATQIRELAADR